MKDSLVTERLVAMLSTGFGFLATLLASIGLYGVMAYTVARRTREIGIRIAIGAARKDVLWLVMREVLTLLAIGIAVALPAAWMLTQTVRSQLYGISRLIPCRSSRLRWRSRAWRPGGLCAGCSCTRVDPMHALRYE